MEDLLKYSMKISNVCSIIHIGGHVGQEVELYKSLNFKRVIYFEPVKLFSDQISQKIKNLKNFELFQFALGSDNFESSINIADKGEDDNSGSTSLLEPRDSEITFSNTESIQIKKYSDLSIKNIDCAIIDTQGYELEVLRGFENKIDDFKFLILEFSNYEGYIGQVLYNDLNKYLNEHNFVLLKQIKKVNKVIPTNKSGSYGDALYININLISNAKSKLLTYRYKLLNNHVVDFLNKFSKLNVYKKLIKSFFKI